MNYVKPILNVERIGTAVKATKSGTRFDAPHNAGDLVPDTGILS